MEMQTMQPNGNQQMDSLETCQLLAVRDKRGYTGAILTVANATTTEIKQFKRDVSKNGLAVDVCSFQEYVQAIKKQGRIDIDKYIDALESSINSAKAAAH
jgi:arginine utilization protein RocB